MGTIMQIKLKVINYGEQTLVTKGPCLISYNILLTLVHQDMFHYEYEGGLSDKE